MIMKSYKDLIVWQKGIRLCTLIFDITNTFPKSELYGITSQMKRSVVSIPSNIAEGQVRGHNEFVQFLKIAYGSGAELDTQLTIALNTKLILPADYMKSIAMLEEILKMLNSLISSLNSTGH